MSKTTEKVILAIILLIGACLRIYNYWDFSLSNDELSALARLNFNSLSDLIQKGVKIDGHPAAAQVLLYYTTQLFGDSVAVVRFPFVAAGITAIYFVYRLGKEWISTSTGLLSAAAFATLIFPLLYTRIARPYSLGMLFAVMAAVYWIRIVKNRHRTSDFVWLAISLALCAYTHYFCALVAAILAITGTFLIKGQSLKGYLLALTAAFILYVPYIPIFLHQLSLGGVGQWLGPPNNDWLWQHIVYVFNESPVSFIAIGIVGILGWIVFRPRPKAVQLVLPFVLFLLPFLIGFAYSIYVNPVLQNSTLLFSFPFLLIFIFSGWQDSKPVLTKLSVGILTTVILFSTVVEKQFFGTNYFGVFKEIAEHYISWSDEVDDTPVLVGDFNYPFYIDRYLRNSEPNHLQLYRTTDEKGLAELKSLVDTSTSKHLIYGWSTVNQTPETEWIIKEKFPVEIKRATYFNSEVVMFQVGKKEVKTETFTFEKNERWNFNPAAVQSESLTGKSVLISKDNPYGPTYSILVSELFDAGFTELVVKVECSNLEEDTKQLMIYEQTNEEGGYAWESDDFKRQFKQGGPNWGVFHYQLKELKIESDVLKVYPWLADGEPTQISLMEIRFY